MDRDALHIAFKSALEWWDVAGVETPPIPPAPKRKTSPPKAAMARKTPLQQAPAKPPTPKPAPKVESAPIAAAAKTLEQLKAAIDTFDAGPLSDNARQAVFSRGNPEADIMVIGEAPGRDEDIQGKPFVGQSGQFLDKIFASIGLSEDTLYITNVVNWRPPKNRNPTAEDIEMCLPFIHRHIALIKPKYICVVGSIAMKALTPHSSITRSRGQWVDITVERTTIPALIIFHPAYVLRQPNLKRETWRDMLSLKGKINAAD
ncbi:MAG: uracil-DNA glycosylase [Maricaulaceae bacterium]